jgi:GT2 family glycosyltransferase
VKTVAAIPNYNMRESIGVVLDSLLADEFDEVFVLDDASTDGSAEYLEAAYPAVTVVRGDRNLCDGGNRNRLLPFLSDEDLVLYVDADLTIESAGLARTVRRWFTRDNLGAVGGLLLDKNGKPIRWNYGWVMTPAGDARVQVYEDLEPFAPHGSPIHGAIRRTALKNRDTYNFEIKHEKPVSRRVEWVSEAVFAVRADVLRQVGGYDERFRYHAGQDLCLRIAAAGRQVFFEPDIAARHMDVDVRGERRSEDFREGKFLLYQKHWGMSRQVFDRLYPEE